MCGCYYILIIYYLVYPVCNSFWDISQSHKISAKLALIRLQLWQQPDVVWTVIRSYCRSKKKNKPTLNQEPALLGHCKEPVRSRTTHHQCVCLCVCLHLVCVCEEDGGLGLNVTCRNEEEVGGGSCQRAPADTPNTSPGHSAGWHRGGPIAATVC